MQGRNSQSSLNQVEAVELSCHKQAQADLSSRVETLFVAGVPTDRKGWSLGAHKTRVWELARQSDSEGEGFRR